MGTSSAAVARSLVLFVAIGCGAGTARADAIGPAPACEPGMAHGGTDMLGGWVGHGGGTPCEPAVCTDASTCGPHQVCRLDAHCIASRETMVATAHGHSESPPVPSMVDFDLGRCESDGTCPEGSGCRAVSTCRAGGDLDAAMAASVFGSRGGTRAAGAWSFARPTDVAPMPATEPSAEPAEVAVAEVAVPTVAPAPAVATNAPAAVPASTCGCSLAHRSPSALMIGCGLALVACWARRRAR